MRWARRLLGVSCKVVFDPRSLFVDEGLLFGAFGEGSLHHKLWQSAERALLAEADRVVSVSDTLGQVLLERSPKARIVTIPTSTNTRIFRRGCDGQARRRGLGLPAHAPTRAGLVTLASEHKVLVYLGNLEAKGWYSAEVLADVYRVFRATFGDTGLLVVTRADREGLVRTLVARGLLEGEIVIAKGERPEEVAGLLQSADYSVIPYGRVTTETERRIAWTVIASKTGEYLCSGLPVIVNETVGAASRLVTEHRVGCTFRLGEENALAERLREMAADYPGMSRRCTELGLAYFDARDHARKYLGIYHELLDPERLDRERLDREPKRPPLGGALDRASIQP
jgi:glycosyltransferase involved in cell wall biosynthesis